MTKTKHATAEVRDTKAKLRAKKRKDDGPSILTPTVIETMCATAEVGAVRDGRGKRHQGDADGGGVHR